MSYRIHSSVLKVNSRKILVIRGRHSSEESINTLANIYIASFIFIFFTIVSQDGLNICGTKLLGFTGKPPQREACQLPICLTK